jgi:hypothetical protein
MGPNGNFKDAIGAYLSLNPDQIIFTATHDTMGLDVVLTSFSMSDAALPQLVTDDSLLGLSFMLSLQKGIPLVLKTFLEPGFSYAGKFSQDPAYPIRNALAFRKAMHDHQGRSLEDYLSLDGSHTVIIERLDDAKNLQGFAILHKGQDAKKIADVLQKLTREGRQFQGNYTMIGPDNVQLKVDNLGRCDQDLSIQRHIYFFKKL